MDSKSLMIGDWVMETNHGQIGKVTYLDANPDCSRIGIQREDGGGFPYSIDVIKPVSLTAEILEKNGFVEEGNLEEGMWFKHPQWNLTLSFYEVWNVVDIVLGNEIGFCEISFVHQLQHALRLCGLNELADNFKVE